MLRALARLIVRKPIAWAIVVFVLLLTAVSARFALHVENDDNLLAFLPKGNPEVKTFYDVNSRFGALDVALVGIATDDPFDPKFLAKLKHVTQSLNDTKGIDFVLSLSSVEDFASDPVKGGIAIDYLVHDLPKNDAEKQALHDKVMSRDQVVGNLIAPNGKAVLLVCFVAYGTDPKAISGRIQGIVDGEFQREPKFWGGGPFIQSYIFSVTQEDLRKLTPWACFVIILISMWSFRDAVGTGLALFSTAVGISVSLGLMGLLGVKTNLVLGSMPIILFALGSAYPIHILTRYYTVAGKMGSEKAVEHAIWYLGPTVIASGLTAVSGLLSFMCMDMEPIRTFGLYTGIGILVTLVLSITFVPAVIRIANLKGRVELATPTSRLMVRLVTFAQTRRVPVGIALGVLALAGGLLMGRLDSRIDNASFYSKASPPAQAEAFLKENFGGSQFLMLSVDGDMTSPEVLREVRWLADRVALLPHVSSVTYVGAVVAKVNEAMEGDERIPDTTEKVKLLYTFLKGKRAVSQLVTDDHMHALMQIKADSDKAADLELLLDRVEELMRAGVATSYVVTDVAGPKKNEAEAKVTAMTLTRIAALAKHYGVPLSPDETAALKGKLRNEGGLADPQPAKAAVLAFLHSEEFLGELPKTPVDAADRIAAAMAALAGNPDKAAVTAGVAKAIDLPTTDPAVGDLTDAIQQPVKEILRRQLALADAKRLTKEAHLTLPEGGKGQRFTAALGSILLDLQAPKVVMRLPPGSAPAAGETAGELKLDITGSPVLNRGLSRSVDQNQLKSFFLAMTLVLIITLVLYRSLWSAMLAMFPVILTLLVTYGGMGLLGVHLDIGTSMLASLVTGAGVDYAVHLLAAWKAEEGGSLKDAATYSAFLVGRAIWTNALMVGIGFLVLTMGQARPLQNVGGLTAAAMIVAALATFIGIPVFAKKLHYDDRPRISGVEPSSNG